MLERSISQRLRAIFSDRPTTDMAKPPYYVVQTENIFGKPIGEPHAVVPGEQPIDIFHYPSLTTEIARLEPDGTLVRIQMYDGEVTRTRVVSSARRPFMDGFKPRFEVVRPAQAPQAPIGITSL